MNSCKKILIANENAEESQRIFEKLTKEKDLFDVKIANDGKAAIDLIKENDSVQIYS